MGESRPVRAKYIGYAKGTENHGDEALVWLIRDLLAPEIQVSPDFTEFDLAILGGGTLINQSPWLIDWFRENLDKARHGLVFGSGVGDELFWGNHVADWRPLLERCHRVAVRGPDSARFLAANGFHQAEAMGDPYLALTPPMARRPSPKRMGINFGTANKALMGGDEDGFLAFFQEMLIALRDDGWSFVWISVWSRDLEIMRNMREVVGVETGPLLDARTETLEAYSALSRCEIFLGEKLHALAMSAVARVPFIALEYQPKVRDFTTSVGMEKWTFSTAECNLPAMLLRVDLLRSIAPAAAAELDQHVAGRHKAIHEFAAAIRGWASGLELE